VCSRAPRPIHAPWNSSSKNDLRVESDARRSVVAQPLRLDPAWRGKTPRVVQRMRPRRNAPQNAVHIREDFKMSQLVAFVKSFSRNEDGQDLLEYALLVALIALIAIGAVGMAGGSVSTIFTNIANSLNNASA
jgi:Flp pilus assembly pilin Flp